MSTAFQTSRYISSASDTPNTQVVIRLLLFTAVVGFYLQISFLIPFSMYYFSGFALLVLLIPRKADMAFLVTLGAIGFASILWFVFSPRLAIFFGEQMGSLLQMLVAMTASIGVLRAISMQPVSLLSRVSLWLLMLMGIGIILEVVGPLRPVSDAFRSVLYDTTIYANDVRDVRTFGWIRPKLFASEPSHVGKFFGLVLFMSIASTKNIKIQIRILVFSLPVIVLIRSPAVLPGFICALSLVVIKIGPGRVFRNPIILFLLAALGGFAVFEIVNTIQTRLIEQIDPSLYIRLVRPFQIALRAMQDRPLLGYGIGSDTQISWLFYETSVANWVPRYVRDELSDTNRLWGASHFALITQLGAIGALVWIGALRKFLRSNITTNLFVFWLFFATYGFFTGVINTAFYWGPMMIILAGLRVSERKEGIFR